MNNKMLCALAFLMMISLTTGIFTEILSTDEITMSLENIRFLPGLLRNIKSDIFTVVVCLLCSMTIYLVPGVIMLVMGKLFSLGFAAAWLLSAAKAGPAILLAVLLPRCLLRLPVYIVLIFLSFQTAGKIKESRRLHLPVMEYGLCLAALMCFSFLEVLLLQCAV